MSLTTQDVNYHRLMMVATSASGRKNQQLSSPTILSNKTNDQDDHCNNNANIDNQIHHDTSNATTVDSNLTIRLQQYSLAKQPPSPTKLSPNETEDTQKRTKISSTTNEQPSFSNSSTSSLDSNESKTDNSCSQSSFNSHQQKQLKPQQSPSIDSTSANVFLYDRSNLNHFRKSSFEDSIQDDSFHHQQHVLNQTSPKDPVQKQLNNYPPAVKIVEDNIQEDNRDNHQSNKKSATMLVHSNSQKSNSSLSSTSVSSTISSTDIAPGHGSSSMDDEEKPLSNRRQWYHLWLPSYKSRLNQFQKQFNDKISSKEKLIDDFVCAIQRELLLQGRMYVSLNYISFYSNIFGYETIINISYQDIHSISKASTVRLFPNAIQIVTNSGLKYFFTSFVSRERAYQLITRLWQFARSEHPMPWPEIRKLIKESYTTHGLGVDLSDIDDADVEIDLSKSKTKKKKHSKRKNQSNRTGSNLNSSCELTNPEDELPTRTIVSTPNGRQRHPHLKHSSSMTTNADVQTDECGFFYHRDHHHDHECSIWHVMGQFRYRLTRMLPSQSQVIRFLFILALVLFIVQLAIYWRFNTLNKRLHHTQELLMDALDQKQQNIHHYYPQQMAVNVSKDANSNKSPPSSNSFCLWSNPLNPNFC